MCVCVCVCSHFTSFECAFIVSFQAFRHIVGTGKSTECELVVGAVEQKKTSCLLLFFFTYFPKHYLALQRNRSLQLAKLKLEQNKKYLKSRTIVK